MREFCEILIQRPFLSIEVENSVYLFPRFGLCYSRILADDDEFDITRPEERSWDLWNTEIDIGTTGDVFSERIPDELGTTADLFNK